MSRRGLLALVLSLAFAVGAVVPGAAAAFDPGATTTTEQFLYVGESAQDWTVPEGVTSVWLEVEGAAGGDGGLGGGAGGSGYGLAGEFATEPGRVLLVYVGGEGKEGATVGSPLGGAGGWPGGGEGGEGSESFFGTAPAVMQGGSGGGGGFSAVAVEGPADPLAESPLIVAAGGGGGGGGASKAEFTPAGDGGAGGRLFGALGGDGPFTPGGGGGNTPLEEGGPAGDSAGFDGGFEEGGGGPAGVPTGGGGGGGWWGGGQGGGFFDPGAAGGGGGSSYAAPDIARVTGLPIPSRSGVVRIVFNPSGGDEEDEDDETINNPSLINPQPVIRGTPAVGQTLTCDPGASSGAQYTTAFQWLRDGGLIDGATGATYVVAAADAGHQLQCRVGITDAAGTAVASSAPVAVPAPAPGGPAVRRAGGSSAIPKATVSKAAAKDAGVSVVLGCGSGGAGACKLDVALIAKAGAKGKVKVGSAATTVAAGRHKRVAVGLNATGLGLLRRRPHLAVSVVVTERLPGGHHKAVATRRLTL